MSRGHWLLAPLGSFTWDKKYNSVPVVSFFIISDWTFDWNVLPVKGEEQKRSINPQALFQTFNYITIADIPLVKISHVAERYLNC